MYYALSQNNDETWRVVFCFDYVNPDRLTLLKESLDDNKNEILGMKVTGNLRDASKVGAEFDGESFSGGVESVIIPAADDVDYWNSVNTYVFLHNNKVVCGIITHKGTSQETFIEEAFSSKVRLFKTPSGQALQLNDVVTWDGEKFLAV